MILRRFIFFSCLKQSSHVQKWPHLLASSYDFHLYSSPFNKLGLQHFEHNSRHRLSLPFLFRTLSLALYGNENNHTQLRLACVMEILNHYRFYNSKITAELEMIGQTYMEMIKNACREWPDQPPFHAASAVIGKAIISLGPHCVKQNEVRICKRRIVGRAVGDGCDNIIVMWTFETPYSVVGMPNRFVLLQALPGVQNPSVALELVGDMELTTESPSGGGSTEEPDEAQENSNGSTRTSLSTTSGRWISFDLFVNLASS